MAPLIDRWFASIPNLGLRADGKCSGRCQLQTTCINYINKIGSVVSLTSDHYICGARCARSEGSQNAHKAQLYPFGCCSCWLLRSASQQRPSVDRRKWNNLSNNCGGGRSSVGNGHGLGVSRLTDLGHKSSKQRVYCDYRVSPRQSSHKCNRDTDVWPRQRRCQEVRIFLRGISCRHNASYRPTKSTYFI